MSANFAAIEEVAREIRAQTKATLRPRPDCWPYPRRAFADAAPVDQRPAGVTPSTPRG
jgi:hypothetical protein